MSSPAANPNRFADHDVDKATILDLFRTVARLLLEIPLSIMSALYRNTLTDTSLTLRQDIFRSVLRCLAVIPRPVLRQITAVKSVDLILHSRRFEQSKDCLFVEILRPGFRAYWICKSPLNSGEPQDMKQNIVILMMHGGAYCFGDPRADAGTYLRVAELAADSGVGLSILSLDYSLAPYAVFPQQQQEAVSAYRFLIEEERVSPSSIVIMGESAGGHLAISFLWGIREASLPKPSAALLLAPGFKIPIGT